MYCQENKIDSNVTGLAFAEEVCLKQLPKDAAAISASGTITLISNPQANDTVIVDGVTYTFVAGAPSAGQVQIGASAAATATALAAVLNATASLASVAAGNVVTVTAAVAGDEGNAITMFTGAVSMVLSSSNLAGGADEMDDPIWYGLEPNSYSDMGGELTLTSRSPIEQSRQNKKGAITDLEASGGFNQDFTQSNTTRLLQGFFFANARQPASTRPLNGLQVPLTAVSATQYLAAAGLAIFGNNLLVKASGFANPNNNGIKRVTASAAGTVTTAEALAVEAAPPATAKLEVVGYQFASGDVQLVMNAGLAVLQATATNLVTLMGTLGLIPGCWVHLGGDAGSSRFSNNYGFARIGIITATQVTFDDITWAPTAQVGTGLTLQMYFGTTIRNEKDAALIVRRSYNIERTLGNGPNGPQAEYLEGAVANEFGLNIPEAEKLNADLSFVACDNSYRSGDPGDERKIGPRVAAPAEDAYNTSSDIYRIKLSVANPNRSDPVPLFGYVTEGSLAINNNVTPIKALGVLGAFDTTAGNFEVTGELTAYFSTVAACKAIRNNADVGLSMIYAARNEGFLFDIPLLGLGGGRVSPEKDQPITIPVTPNGAESKFGHTLLYTNFAYLPNIAMPLSSV